MTVVDLTTAMLLIVRRHAPKGPLGSLPSFFAVSCPG